MQQSPARPPLIERSVNTSMAGIVPAIATKTNKNLKRQINNVDSPNCPPSPLRLRITQDSPMKEHRGEPIVRDASMEALPSEPATGNTEAALIGEDVEKDDSLDTHNDSVSSSASFDATEDTMASQQTVATETSQPGRTTASMHAEVLRLRLRVAMFKVRTGQTALPMSQLCISPNSPQLPTPISQVSSRGVSTAPKLLPAPVLQPTAYSARMNEPPQMPSSPPASEYASPREKKQTGSDVSRNVFRTPALPKHKKLAEADHTLSSPPDSQPRVTSKRPGDERELTSSAVRGSAARGLLGLMQSR